MTMHVDPTCKLNFIFTFTLQVLMGSVTATLTLLLDYINQYLSLLSFVFEVKDIIIV